MAFTWRELWSCEVGDDLDLELACFEGVVVGNGETHDLIDSLGVPVLGFYSGSLCCWNGDLVFSSFDRRCLLRYRDGAITELVLQPCTPLHGDIRGIVALQDGALFVWTESRGILARDMCDVVVVLRDLKPAGMSAGLFEIFDSVPWLNGFIYDDFDEPSVMFYDPSRGEGVPFLRYENGVVHAAVFSDEKHACVVVMDEHPVLCEWDAQGRKRVFAGERCLIPGTRRSILRWIFRSSGTCRGRALVSVDTIWNGEGPFEAFVYLGDGRFEKGPPAAIGDWKAYGDRAYVLCGTTLTCYEALETPDSLVDLCARRAGALGISSERLGTLPVELRELLSSWT